MDTYEHTNLDQQESQQPAEQLQTDCQMEESGIPEQAAELLEQTQPVGQTEQPQAEPAPEQTCQIPQQPAEEPIRYRQSPYANSPYVQQPMYRPEPVMRHKSARPGKGKAWKAVLSAVLALVILASACAATAVLVGNRWENRVSDLQKAYDQKLGELEDKLGKGSTVVISGETPQGDGYTPAQVYAMSVDGVVIINSKVTYTEYGQTQTGISTGSGFVISEDGYVVTNYHVVDGAASIIVGTNDGEEHPAELIGYDNTNDVALLKLNTTGLHALPIGDSDNLIVGDRVAAIGNPLGELTSTLTVGYISAKERDVNTDGFAINMLQTDAAINSGNSGGPLLNMYGQVIGITTAKYSGTSSSGATIEGVGFAIPINDVMDLLSDLMTYGYVNSGYLGVSVSDVDAAAAAYFGGPRGARVEEVVAGYAAHRAGIQVKDIITAIGEYPVETVNDLTRMLRRFAPGDATTVTVYRGGRELVLHITLDEKPKEGTAQNPQNDGGAPTDEDWAEWYEKLKPFFNGGDGQTYDEWFQQFKDQFGK